MLFVRYGLKVTTQDELIGDRVRELRTAAGMSQADLSRLLVERGLRGFHPQTITRIEQGARSLKLSEAVDLADALGAPVEALFEPSEAAREIVRQVADVRHLLGFAERIAIAAEGEAHSFSALQDDLRSRADLGKIGGLLTPIELAAVEAIIEASVHPMLDKAVLSVIARMKHPANRRR